MQVAFVAGAKASGATKSISECTMARVFEGEISTLAVRKPDLLVYTDDVGSAGAATVGVTVAASASNGRGYGGRTVWVTVCGQVEAEARIVAA